MKLIEKIEAILHYENGGEVEFKFKYSDEPEWVKDNKPDWDWNTFEYRIKTTKQKVIIEKWLMQDTIDKEYRIIETSLVDKVVNLKKVKLLETYEVEL